MNKKKRLTIFTTILILFFASIFYRNISTFNSLKKNTAYTYGTIVKVWDDDGSWYSRYQYSVNEITYQGRQGEKHNLTDTVLIVFDSTKPRFSMIAKYNLPIALDNQKNIKTIDTIKVEYIWWNYLPGDEINSIKDLWCLD
jgi:hypothetical protein